MNDEKPPKVFISYRWSSPEHEAWVLSFATSLRNDGIDAVLDKWHLREGQDTLAFMEAMVSDPNVIKVLLICDTPYVERANQRKGGVGTEAQIVSAKVYESTSQDKFSAIVKELDADGRPILPNYMQTRLYFDMSSRDAEVANYEKVVRWIFGRPFHVAPEIGSPPGFLDETYKPSRDIQIESQRFERNRNTTSEGGVLSAPPLLQAALREIEGFSSNLSGEENPDEIIYSKIVQTQSLREEIYRAFRELCRSSHDTAADAIHSFLEGLLPIMDRTPLNVAYTRIDNDVSRYIAHDSLVSFVAIALAERNFRIAANVLSMPFFKKNLDRATGEITSYSEFLPNVSALEIRSKRLNLNRISFHADVIKELHSHSLVTFDQFMEADFTLYTRSLISPKFSWYPVTALYLVYGHGMLPTYARAQSAAFYNRLKVLLMDMDVDRLRQSLLPHTSGEAKILRFDYRELDIKRLMNLDGLASAA